MAMKKLLLVAAVILAMMWLAPAATAQQAPVNSPLLDHLAGKWLMEGTVGKQSVTHEFEAEWVLGHHYLRFHEASREKNDKGEPQYEATVFIGWNEKTGHYACAWMDVYGGLTTESIGLAPAKENELGFVFRDENGETNFTNTFIYDPKTDTWEDRLDNVVKGEAKPFAHFKMRTR
jgi:opacity protein-like surface antigen